MRTIPSLLFIGLALLSSGCSRTTEEKIADSIDEVETKLAESKAEVSKMLAAALERWEELRPDAERALASLEDRVEKLVHDAEALKRITPETLARVRTRIDALRAKLAEANADHEEGHTDVAVEKADEVQRETAQVEELLVERPDVR